MITTANESPIIIDKTYMKKPIKVKAYITDKEITINNGNGDLIASKGDYIITGTNGETYPCKPDIFNKTYDYVVDDIYSKKPVKIKAHVCNKETIINTLEGPEVAHIGDYIITGVNGEQYPVNSKTFKDIYTEV